MASENSILQYLPKEDAWMAIFVEHLDVKITLFYIYMMT